MTEKIVAPTLVSD